MVIAVVLALLGGLCVGAYLASPAGPAPEFTFFGTAVQRPEEPLARAEAAAATLVRARHGVAGQPLRCYYALPAAPQPSAGMKKTDVGEDLWCGPVLFVDGDPAAEYLRFALSGVWTGATVTLRAAAGPVSPDPAALPPDTVFKRLDGAAPPAGAGGLRAPDPPPADTDLLTTATDLGGQPVPAAPADAVIGSINGGIRLTALGPITRFGAGDDARSAPPGERLIAFQLGAGYDANGDAASLLSSTTVAVGSGAGRALPACAADGCYYLVAVPTDAPSADLVLTDAGRRQTLSLLTGQPGRGNLAVLARAHRASSARKSFSVPVTLSEPVVFPDGVSGDALTLSAKLTGARLDWTPPGASWAKPSKPGNALLTLSLTYTDAHDKPARGYAFEPGLLTFTPAGGKPIKARNISHSAASIYDTFEVPASLTSGTLTIAGSTTRTFLDGGDFTLTVARPVRVPVTFPRG
ncbi:MAG: hypothetical protein FWD74_07855 [Actinomycetia bacterium]|nr:hypothetical protein [Actinomycetes bacterium]